MKPYTKMMIATAGRRQERDEHRDVEPGRDETNMRRYGGYRMEYDGNPNNKFRDDRGREHYDNGRYAPQNWLPPIYRDQPKYRYDDDGGRMIGFAGGQEIQSNGYRTDATYMHRDEMQPRRSERQAGYASSEVGPMDRATAKKWVSQMQNADGSTGGHWSMEQTSQILRQRGYQHGQEEWYAILNAMYSDYCRTAKQFGVDNVDFYASMAHDWLDDDDAREGKAERYYCYIVEK